MASGPLASCIGSSCRFHAQPSPTLIKYYNNMIAVVKPGGCLIGCGAGARSAGAHFPNLMPQPPRQRTPPPTAVTPTNPPWCDTFCSYVQGLTTAGVGGEGIGVVAAVSGGQVLGIVNGDVECAKCALTCLGGTITASVSDHAHCATVCNYHQNMHWTCGGGRAVRRRWCYPAKIWGPKSHWRRDHSFPIISHHFCQGLEMQKQ